MDEARFFYYSNLAKYSLTNNLILLILIIIEMYPIFIDFIEAPFLLRNYYKEILDSDPFKNINNKTLYNIKKISFYKLFRKLRNDDKLYPIYILIPMLSLVIIYIIFFAIFSIIEQKNKKKGIYTKKSFTIYFKIILVNLYDHVVFRTGSLYVYEVIINYLIISKNYLIIITMIIIFSITFYLNIQYFNTFRLSIKYDLDYKYVYDGKYMFYADYFSLLLKLSTCFSHNVYIDTIIVFFILFNFIIISCSVLKFVISNCFNLVNCSKGMIFVFLFFLFVFHIIFPSIRNNNSLYCIYIVLCFLSALVITIYLRYYKILKVIRTPITPENNSFTQEKFELLCEYYQHSNFNYLLNQICFAMKIKISDEKMPLIQTNIRNTKSGIKSMKNNNILLHNFLTFISNKFKEDSQNKNLDKDINLFYYIICKIYLELMTNQQNNFYLLFETRKILIRLKKYNLVLYYDLKFFYELLCQSYSFQNNTNFLIYNDAYFNLFEVTKNFLSEYQNFITKRNYLKINNYINISKLVNDLSKKIKKNYEILSTSSYKDEYQTILFRVILEGLFNRGITKDPTSLLLINEEFSIYEEMLEKQYHSEKQLKIIIELQKMGSKIIKIGKELNFLWNENIDSMFPSQFIQIAKKKFYFDYETQEKNIGGQMFKFFVWDNEKNLRQFIYIYKIYPKLKNDITYLDGYYQLGNEPLLITERDYSSNQENIILISQSLQSLLYINQNLIEILEQFQININLNCFIHNINDYTFHFKTYVKYLNNILEKILNLASKTELTILEPLIKEIKELDNINVNNISYQLINLFSIVDNELVYQKVYNIYTLKQVKNKNILKEASTVFFNMGEEDNIYNLSAQNDLTSVLNAFDSNSVSSVKGLGIGFSLLNKKKNISNKHQNGNNLVIIILNLLVIIIAIVALIYENYLNNLLLKKIYFYKTIFSFNRLILNTMFGFYSLLCYSKHDGKKCIHEMKYYLKDIGFSDIYTFNQYEHQLKINSLSDRYKTLKNKVKEINDIEIKNYLNSKKTEIHLVFENNTIRNDKTSNETFDYLMGSFINKLIVSSNSDDFQTTEIYPLIVNEQFRPVNLVNTNNLTSLGNTQIYIYEIMISYLDYANHFYDLQEVTEKKSYNQINVNKKTLIVFIIILIFSCFLISGSSFYFFENFKKILNNKIQSMEILLKDEENVQIINKKLKIISIIFKFYKHNPLKLIKKLSDKMKILNNKKFDPQTHSSKLKNNLEENYEIQKIKQKKYVISFILNKFFYILTILIFIYLLYNVTFLFIANDSFTDLYLICKIIATSSYTCFHFFLELGIIELYQFIKIPENALYNTLWTIYNNKISHDGGNAFVDLLNIIQDTIQNEKSVKELQKSFTNITKIISMDCTTIYSEMNDERFSIIFKEHSEKNFEEILINYCNNVGSLHYKSEQLFIEDLTYSMMKLLIINYKNENYIPNYNIYELYSVTIKSLVLYRPLKAFLDNYYFSHLDKQTIKHFNILVMFLLGNIILEIIFFFIIKTQIIDKIDNINKNLNKLLIMLKCNN